MELVAIERAAALEEGREALFLVLVQRMGASLTSPSLGSLLTLVPGQLRMPGLADVIYPVVRAERSLTISVLVFVILRASFYFGWIPDRRQPTTPRAETTRA